MGRVAYPRGARTEDGAYVREETTADDGVQDFFIGVHSHSMSDSSTREKDNASTIELYGLHASVLSLVRHSESLGPIARTETCWQKELGHVSPKQIAIETSNQEGMKKDEANRVKKVAPAPLDRLALRWKNRVPAIKRSLD